MELASTHSESLLPHGWTVQVSKTYPGNVYYFNTISGVSSWTLPDSRIFSSEERTGSGRKSKPGSSKKAQKRKKDKTSISGSREQSNKQQQKDTISLTTASSSKSDPSKGGWHVKKTQQSVDKCAHQQKGSKEHLLLTNIDQSTRDGRKSAGSISSGPVGDVRFCLGLSELGHTVCLEAKASRTRNLLSQSSCGSTVLSDKPNATHKVEDNLINKEAKQRKRCTQQQIHSCLSETRDKAHVLHCQHDGKQCSEGICSRVYKTQKTNAAMPSKKEFDVNKHLEKICKKKKSEKNIKKLFSSGVKTLLCAADSVEKVKPVCVANTSNSALKYKQCKNVVCTTGDVHNFVAPRTTDRHSYSVGEVQCQLLASQLPDITTSLGPSTDCFLPPGNQSTQISQHEKRECSRNFQVNASSSSTNVNKMDRMHVQNKSTNASTSFARDDAQLGSAVLGTSLHDAADVDYMEVDLFDEDSDTVMVDIQAIQEHIRTLGPQSNQPVGMLTQTVQNFSTSPAPTVSIPLLDKKVSTVKNLFIVLDTNVLIKSLGFVKSFHDISIKDWGLPHLVIPWVVLQELDSLKGKKYKLPLVASVQHDAQQAVRYLHSCLTSAHPRVRWQTPAEASQVCQGSQFVIENNDDRVINCCLQYQQKYPHAMVLLLTEDINLQNKTMVVGLSCSDIKSLSSKLADTAKEKHFGSLLDLPAVLDSINQKNPLAEPSIISDEKKIQDERAEVDKIMCSTKAVLSGCLKPVIEADLKEAYGDLWLDVACKKPPWSVDDLLCLLCKHWMAVFSVKLPRTLKDVAEDLSKKLKAVANHTRLAQIQDTVKNCLQLVGGLQLNKSYATVAEQAQRLLTKLYDKVQVCGVFPTQEMESNSSFARCSFSQPSLSSNNDSEKNSIPNLEKKVPQNQKEKPRLFTFNSVTATRSKTLETYNKVAPCKVAQAANRLLTQDKSQKTKVTVLQSLPSSSEKKGAVGRSVSRIHQDLSNGSNEVVCQQSAAKCPSKPKVQTLAANVDVTKTVMDRFQAVWSTINSCCCMVEEAVKRDLSPNEKTGVKENLLNLASFLRQLHTQFAQCLSFSPVGLEKQTFAFDQFCNSLNNFFSHINVPAPDLPDTSASQMISLMSQGKSRVTLAGGLCQLAEFISRVDKILSCL